MLQFIISSVPLAVMLFALWFKYGKNKNLLNIIFWGYIFSIGTLFIGPLFDFLDSSSFLHWLFVAGVTEEALRLYCTIFSKPQSKNDLIYNCFIISAVFTSIEDYCYYSRMNGNYNQLLLRAIGPVHLFFALLMVVILIRAYDCRESNKKKSDVYKVLAFVLPAVIHGSWDYLLLNTSGNKLYLLLTFAAIPAYLFPLIYIICKVKTGDTNNDVIKVNIWKKLIMIIYSLLFIISFHI